MNGFWRRLRFFGIGFGLGLVFVFFFFKNRGCTWLPENRVKNTILGRVLVVDEDQESVFKQKGLTRKDLVQFLNDGDVNFGESNKQGNPQVYSVSKTIRNKEFTLWFTLPKDAFISEVRWPNGSIQKAINSTTGDGEMIYFPAVKNMVFLDDNTDLVSDLNQLQINDAQRIMKAMKASGKIHFDRSNLKATPYPEHMISFYTKKGALVTANTIWKEEHIQFFHLQKNDSLK